MTHKYGKIETNQRYKCVRCGKQFRSKYQLTIDADTLWKQYYEGKQTIHIRHRRNLYKKLFYCLYLDANEFILFLCNSI